MSKLNYKIIIHIIGVLLLFNGGLMLLSSLVSLLMKDGVTFEITLSSFVVMILGGGMMLPSRHHKKHIQKREGYLIVTLGWVFVSFTGMIPFLLTGAIPLLPDAFFESVSGYTATGSSILTDIESLPYGVLFWRSMTHWIGGMGIIVLAIAVLPLLGIGGMQLFSAEVSGPHGDKIHPRIAETAKRLWLIYILYTIAETFFLYLAGMSLFDSLNHSMSTMASGGFSTKNDSLAHWNHLPLIQYIVIIFMFLAGTNFILSYFVFKGNLKRLFKDEEFILYLKLILILTVIVSLTIITGVDFKNNSFDHPQVWGKMESSVRHAAFQVIAIITTTGFVTSDFTVWSPFLKVLFFGLMFIGGSAGSTSGGIKIVRHLLMIKSGLLEFKKALHPNAIIQTRYIGKVVNQEIIGNILGFFIIYMLSFMVGALGFSMFGLDFQSALGVSASSLGNVGPSIGDYGPMGTFSEMPILAKWWSSFLMIVGRLELFTVLIIFTAYFWKKR